VRQKEPLRTLSEDERAVLVHLNRSAREAAAQVAGRRSGDAVARLVARFNAEGLDALVPRHGGERQAVYASAERDGTATWSLVTSQRTLRRASDGLPAVSTYTIWCVLSDAGWSWQHSRTWCPTGTAVRKRNRGPVTVHDVGSEAKKG
jgi:transposase